MNASSESGVCPTETFHIFLPIGRNKNQNLPKIVFLIYVGNYLEFMNTIDAFEKDIFLQLDFLKSFEKQKTISSSNLQRNNVIFSGCGDSLVSAMLAESFSGGLVRAMDPLDLYKNKRLIQSKHMSTLSPFLEILSQTSR